MLRHPIRLAVLVVLATTPHCVGGRPGCDAPPTVVPFLPALSEPGMLFRGTFAADEATFSYFKKVTAGQEDYRIYRTRLEGEAWTPRERVDLGGDYSDLYPAISSDGRTMVFSSYRPVPGDTSAHPNAHLWSAEWDGADWGPPRLLGDANLLGHYHSGPYIGRTGAVRLIRTTPDWRSRAALVTTPADGRYGPSRPVADPRQWTVPTGYVHWSTVISPDGSTAILLVGRRAPESVRVGKLPYRIDS